MNNAMLRIQVRVIGRDAERQIASLEKRLASLDRVAMRSGNAWQNFIQKGIKGNLQHLNKLGKDLQWTGRQLEYRFTLPILLAGGAATKFALDNEKAFTRLRKVYGGAGDDSVALQRDLGLLRRAFEALSNRFGVNQSEVIAIGALWAQAGAKGIALAKATELTLQTMILGEMAYEEAGKALIILRAQYGFTTTELRSALALLNTIENETAVSFGDLIDAITRGAGSARTAGVDIQHFSAMIAALVPATGSAATAGNALKTIFSRLLAPTKQAGEALKWVGDQIGVNIVDPSLSGVERIELLAKAFEDLTPAQRAIVSSAVAGRYQIARLDVLLRDVVNPLGEYQKALRVTGDEQANLARMTNELGIYLSSQPQAFKILVTQLQNMLAKIIVPMLPAILGLLSHVRDLVLRFTQLSPTMQKTVLVGLAFVAMLGPIVAMLGAFKSLTAVVGLGFFYIGKGLWFALVPLRIMAVQLGGLLLRIIAGGAPLAAKSLVPLLRGLRLLAILPFQLAAGPLSKFLAQISIGAQRAASAAAVSSNVMVRGFAFAFRGIAILANATWTLIAGSAAAAGSASGSGFTLGAALGVKGAVALLVAAAAIALVALAIVFRKQVGNALDAAWDTVYSWGTAFGRFIGDVFEGAINIAVTNLKALPGAVYAAFRAVINIVAAAARAFYEWLSYFNPFAKHSPSLVQQVQDGVDLIAREYASLGDIGRHFRTAVADLKAFEQATAAARAASRAGTFAEQREATVEVAPGAGGAFDATVASILRLESALDRVGAEFAAQERVVARWKRALDEANAVVERETDMLDRLRDAADDVGTELDAARSRLDELVNTPIQGMGAMADAIFENEMAQKRFNLELLRMEEAGHSIEDLEGQISSLNGELELLYGERESLRLGGAGSDILGVLDARIGALRDKRSDLEDAGEAVADLRDELEALERQGRILDLEESLRFDPIRRQIEQVTNSMKEMPFDELLNQIIDEQREVDRLNQRWEEADAAVKAQERVVDAAEDRRDAIERTFDFEDRKLTQLGEAYDAIEQQIDDATEALDAFAQMAEKAAEKAGGIGDALAAAGGGSFPIPGGEGGAFSEPGDLEALVDQWEKDIEDAFGDFDIKDIFLDPFKKAWHKVEDWWKKTAWPWLKKVPGELRDAFLEGSGDILFGLSYPFRAAYRVAKEQLTLLVDNVAGVPGRIVSVLAGFGEFVWNGIVGGVEFVVGMFGGSVDKSIKFYEEMPGKVVDKLADFGGFVWRGIRTSANWLKDRFKENVDRTRDFFAALPGRVVSALINFGSFVWNGIVDSVNFLKDRFGIKVFEIIGKFVALPGAVIAGLWNVGEQIWFGIAGSFNWLKDRAGEIVDKIVNFFRDLPGKIAGFAGDVLRAAKDIGSSIARGIKEGLGDIVFGEGRPSAPGPRNGPDYDSGIPHEGAALGGVYAAKPGGHMLGNLKVAEVGRRELYQPLPAGLNIGQLSSTVMRVDRTMRRFEAGQPLSDRVVSSDSLRGSRELHFHGDLSFPNVKDGRDAETFIRNLEALVD